MVFFGSTDRELDLIGEIPGPVMKEDESFDDTAVQ